MKNFIPGHIGNRLRFEASVIRAGAKLGFSSSQIEMCLSGKRIKLNRTQKRKARAVVQQRNRLEARMAKDGEGE